MKIIEDIKKRIRKIKFAVIKTVVTKATDERVLNLALEKGDSLTRMYLATNPSLTMPILEQLEKDESVFVRCQVVNNSIVTAEMLERLSLDSNQKVRAEVAKHKECNVKTLEKLSRDSNVDVIAQIVTNENLNEEMMTNLSQQKSHDILTSLLKNNNLTTDILKDIIFNNNDYGIKYNVARHPNIDSDIVIKNIHGAGFQMVVSDSD